MTLGEKLQRRPKVNEFTSDAADVVATGVVASVESTETVDRIALKTTVFWSQKLTREKSFSERARAHKHKHKR